MKYASEAALSEILRRRDALLRARRRRTLTALSCSTAALIVALSGMSASLGGARVPMEPGGDYGAFLLSAEAGGYVLASVIAFMLGTAFAALCIGRQKRRGNARDQAKQGLRTTIEKDEE